MSCDGYAYQTGDAFPAFCVDDTGSFLQNSLLGCRPHLTIASRLVVDLEDPLLAVRPVDSADSARHLTRIFCRLELFDGIRFDGRLRLPRGGQELWRSGSVVQ